MLSVSQCCSCQDNVHFPLHTRSHFQLPVKLANTCIKKVACVGQLTWILNIKHKINHNKCGCCFQHGDCLADESAFKVQHQTVVGDDNIQVHGQLIPRLKIVILILSTTRKCILLTLTQKQHKFQQYYQYYLSGKLSFDYW